MVLHVTFPWWVTKAKVGLFTWLSQWKDMWTIWNLRTFILLSLALQVLLIFLAPFRKRTANTVVIIFIWLAYLLADYIAIQAVGLVPKNDGKPYSPNEDVLAFWAPFLLVHLGGPDPITALALEDNELWMRTGLHLFTYAAATGRVFFQSLPFNALSIPTFFMFFVGILKYLERTLSLYYARLSQFKTSMLKEPDPGPNYAKLMESYDSYKHSALPARFDTNPEPEQYNDDDNNNNNEDNNNEASSHGADLPAPTDPTDPLPPISKKRSLIRSIFGRSKVDDTEMAKEVRLKNVMLVRKAFDFYELYKGLYVDLIFSFLDRKRSREYFLDPKLTPKDAFKILEMELNFTYEVFYTKMIVIHQKFGTWIRSISFSLEVVCLLIWILFIDKTPYQHRDVVITYILLVGAIVIDSISFVIAVISDWQLAMLPNVSERRASLYEALLSSRERNWGKHWGPNKDLTFMERIRRVLFRRWSESVFQFNLIHYCVHQWSWWAFLLVKIPPIKDKLEGVQLVSKKWFADEFRDFIYREIKYKAEIAEEPKDAAEICESKGDWVLRSLAGLDFEPFTFYRWTVDVEYDECLLLWHIATELLYQEEEQKKGAPSLSTRAGVDASPESTAGVDASPETTDGVDPSPETKAGVDEPPPGKKDEPKTETLEEKHIKYSKTLSDYMMYLLSRQQVMMAGVAGISEVRFRDTCAEANIFFDRVLPKKRMKNETTEERIMTACKRMMDVNTETEPKAIKGDRSKSVLFDGVVLAKQLKDLREKSKTVDMWELIAKVWVELLSYSATHTRASVHAAQLRKGGELLTLIWLLMVHVGLATQFKINQGNARSKLIISK